jgi:hypothetical protein
MHRTGRSRFALLAVLLATACALAGSPASVAPRAAPCEFDNVERIVAVGDVHGAYDQFLEILRAATVIDARNRWIGGRTHLVQTGDVLDRGADSRKALEFLRRLARDAERAGGRVHALLGNHEAMRLLGDFRYVVPGEYAAFTDADSVARRRALLERQPPDQRRQIEQETPLGMIEMIQAFGPGQDLGAYLRTLNAVVRINGVVFLHGGISPAVASKPCAVINDAIRRELGPDFEQTRETPGETLTAGADGPLWYRGLALEPETFAPEVRTILDAQRARAIVVGHSTSPGAIRSRFDGTVFLIDTGMQAAYYAGGRASALEIRGDVFTAIYTDSRQIIAGGGVP